MIYIVLPAYHEEVGLEPLVRRIAATMKEMDAAYQIVVINDGSRDRTGDILARLAAEFPIHPITHRLNRGLGETIRDGFEYVAEVGTRGDIVVRMDCDDTHDPKYIKPMVERLREGYEVAIASRYAPGGGTTGLNAYRTFISRGANTLMKIVFPIKGVWEYTCGYRAYRVALIKDCIDLMGNQFIDLKGMGFTGTVEKIIKCRIMGARIVEVPFVLLYDRKHGPSKVVTSLTTLGYLVLIAKFFYPWGDIGKAWKAGGQKRRRTAYGPDGLPQDKVEIGPTAPAEPK